MKKILFLGLSLLFFGQMYSQDAVFDWARSIGSSGLDRISDLTVDDIGNAYTTGSYDRTIDFDPGVDIYDLTPIGSFDIYISKLNALGEFVWAKSIGNSSLCTGNAIYSDNDFVYITGSFRGTVDFDPGPEVHELTGNINGDIFVLKLDADGSFVWANSIGDALQDSGSDLVVGESGNIFITGYFQGTVDFDPSAGIYELTSIGEEDVFIQKLNSDGDFIWAKSFGGPAEEEIESISIDEFENVYLGGRFEGTCDFDPGVGVFSISSIGLFDGYVVKLNSDGNFSWAVQIGGTSQETVYSVKVDNDGNVYSAGSFVNTVDFEPGPGITEKTSNGSRDNFVQKLSEDGEFIWVKTFGGLGWDQIFDMHLGDHLLLTGYFTQTVDFDPGIGVYELTYEGGTDLFFEKLDLDGNFIWAKVIGSTDFDEGNAISTDNDGNVYLTGTFERTVDFDPGLGEFNIESIGELDIFILKLNSCTIDEITDEITSCISHTWINGETYFTDNNTATFTLTNLEGCDSIISLDLTINEVDISTTSIDGVITSNATGATYQWLDCNDSYSEIPGETSNSYTADEDGSYAVRVQQGECVDTSDCIIIAGVGITDENKSSKIKIFPNPSNGLINVDLSGLSGVLINVYALNGEVVYSSDNLNDQIHSFQLNVETGIYIVEVITNEHLEQLKLVVD